MTAVSILLPFDAAGAASAAAKAHQLREGGHEVTLAGPGAEGLVNGSGVKAAATVLAALEAVRAPITVIGDAAMEAADPARLSAPILSDQADAVFGRRASTGVRSLADQALGAFASWVVDVTLTDPLAPVRAFRTATLKDLKLSGDDSGIDAEILVKLSARRFRIVEVPVEEPPSPPRWTTQWGKARTLFRYASVQHHLNDSHEGFTMLERLQAAPHYNAWIGRKLRPFLGSRVLEVGAGLGTITRELEAGLELLIALEVDAFFVDRLKNQFLDKPHVRPYLSGVERADWDKLAAERLDSVVLTNVLEHIEDDAEAVRNFRRVLQPGGRLVVWVPALPRLLGAMDRAVGHHRRYLPETLRAVLEENGFQVEHLEWLNLVGIPGWYLNSVVLKRRAIPSVQLRAYDAVMPALARLESLVRLPVGLSLFAVARAEG